MKKINTKRPKFVVKNSSNTDVRVLNGATIKKQTTVDLFKIIKSLPEATVIDALREPEGTLYRELYITQNLELVDFELISFSNNDIESHRVVPTTVIEAAVPVLPPLINKDGKLTLPKASKESSGYISKEDWLIFSNNGKQTRVWQYQDFPHPSGKELILNQFENGEEPFNPDRIIDGSAVVVSMEQPDRFLYGGSVFNKWLKKEQVLVCSHIGSQIRLNTDNSQNCRVWFLVFAPNDTNFDKYIPAPKIVHDARIELINTADVDGAGTHRLPGGKVFVNDIFVKNKIGIGIQSPEANLDVAGSVRAQKLLLPEAASQGHVLTSDNLGQATWAPLFECLPNPPANPRNSQMWAKMPDGELFLYDEKNKYWLGTSTIQLSGSKNLASFNGGYLNGIDGVPTSHSSLVLPFDAILFLGSASSQNQSSWTAEIHSDMKEVNGGMINCVNGRASMINSGVVYRANSQISIYVRGSQISMPSVTVLFKRLYI